MLGLSSPVTTIHLFSLVLPSMDAKFTFGLAVAILLSYFLSAWKKHRKVRIALSCAMKSPAAKSCL